ncbi:hypothetical protein, partial [Moorena sp. SIO1F2]|uniref:hypothetical protein n=1 Tax=Moorena sp. SIO1F2 TaxID=2607819 RepID=UPI0025DE7DF4
NETRSEFFASNPDVPVIELTYPVDEIEFFFNNRTYTKADSTISKLLSMSHLLPLTPSKQQSNRTPQRRNGISQINLLCTA